MIKDTDTLTWLGLMLLTLGLIAGVYQHFTLYLILPVTIIKFLAVSFQFMELKKAHLFWKVIVTILVLAVSFSLLILLPE